MMRGLREERGGSFCQAALYQIYILAICCGHASKALTSHRSFSIEKCIHQLRECRPIKNIAKGNQRRTFIRSNMGEGKRRKPSPMFSLNMIQYQYAGYFARGVWN